MKPNLLVITAGLAALSQVQAATIMYVGVETNIDSKLDDGATIGWHSTGNAKALDIDGDNALGTDGWRYAGNGGPGLTGIMALPAYITSGAAVTPNANINAAYGLMDGPTVAVPGVNPAAAEIAYGSWWRNATTVVIQDIVSFTISNAALIPSGETLRLGILFDTLTAGSVSGSQTYTLTQTVGGSATASSTLLTFNYDGMDAAFFDLTGLATNDTFLLTSTNAAGSYSHVGGLTFDTAVPEPSVTLLGSLGLLALLRRRR